MSGSERVPPAKTERSHEENQERAYIAASRRADRSLEARVQSAKMASEIHRRRTGRGLKVTEEIVVKEEMYEEEEDDMPRHYKYLTAHLQTNSPEMNNRVNAYITTQAAMATMARYNEVNKLFSESFPTAAAYQQQMNNSMYMSPLMTNGSFPHSTTGPASAQASPTTSTRAHSVSGPSQIGNMGRRESNATSIPTPNTPAVSSPPALSPGTTTSEGAESRSTPRHTPAFANLPLDPQLVQQQPTSSFTSELPNQVKMMANIDMNDPMAMHFFGGNPSAYQDFGQFSGISPSEDLKAQNVRGQSLEDGTQQSTEQNDEAFFSPVDGSMDYLDFSLENYSRLGTPGGGMGGDAWDSFVDFGAES